MAEPLPNDQALDYLDRLSNWGRWGDDDELGTLNLIKEEHRVAAAQLVRTGRVVSCARPLRTAFGDPASAAQMYWVVTGEGACAPEGSVPPTRFGSPKVKSAVEYIGFVYHGPNCTHIDTPAHLFWEGRLYNDRPASLTTAEFGATWCPVTNMKDGIVSRGVLLDVPRFRDLTFLEPGTAVTPDELSAVAEAQGVTVGEGDIVLLRTGRWHPDASAGIDRAVSDDPAHWAAMAGWHPACMEWMHERGVAMIGSDSPQEARPAVYPSLPGGVHTLALTRMGMPLVDNCELEGLASVCADEKRWEFQFVVSPLPLEGGSGSPINPIAIF